MSLTRDGLQSNLGLTRTIKLVKFRRFLPRKKFSAAFCKSGMVFHPMHLAELDSSSCPHYSVCFNLNIWIAFWVIEARKMLKSHVHIWVCLHQDKSDASEIYRVIPMWVDAGSGVFGRFNLCCVICYCSLYCLCSVLFCMKLPIKKGESQLLLNEFNSDLIKNHEAAVSMLSLLSFNWSRRCSVTTQFHWISPLQ